MFQNEGLDKNQNISKFLKQLAKVYIEEIAKSKLTNHLNYAIHD